MFRFLSKKKTLLESGYFQGFTDWHCHILPGVDDGFGTLKESLDILAQYEKAGISQVWLTPHIMEDVPNTTSFLREHYKRFIDAYQQDRSERNAQGQMIQLSLASENMLDTLFEERLSDGDLLPLEDKRLLVETSYYCAPFNFHQLLKSIQSAGFSPVLAHPERYLYMKTDEYETLKRMGILFQMNLTSLLGFYGPEPQRRAKYLKEKGYYDYVGTDLHRGNVWKKITAEKISV